MKKWAGYFLSDHTLKINRQKKADSVVYPHLAAMSEEEISRILLDSFANHRAIKVQLKTVDSNGNMLPFIEGFAQGYEEDRVIVADRSIALSAINHVSLL